MQTPDTTDAPLVPYIDLTPETGAADGDTDATRSDGGHTATLDFDRPPRTDHATEYTRDEEEIEPFVADLR